MFPKRVPWVLQFHNMSPGYLQNVSGGNYQLLDILKRYLDFGRCDADQEGLITFKSRWGAAQSEITYSRYGALEKSTHLFDLYSSKWKSRAAKGVLKRVSPTLLPAIGRILYRHIG